MREIKFRAWDKKDKVMREVYGIQFPKISNHGNRENTIIEMHCSDYEEQKAILLSDFTDSIDRIELMQYTGLKDKNGKEIYEGDIIRHDMKADGFTPEYSKIANLVIWEQKEARFKLDDGGSFGMIYKGYEVIGNIYENPELLNK